MKKSMHLIPGTACLCGALFATSIRADVGTAWTYQGELTKAGALYTGSADFLFSLWSAESAGTQIESTLTVTNAPVAAGRFAARLDFGYDPFQSGQNLWLQIAVRSPAGSGGMYTTLATRQPITATPYAVRTRGMFVTDDGDVGFGTTLPDLDVQVSRTRYDLFGSGPFATTLGTRHDFVEGLPSNQTRTTNWLYLRAGTAGDDIVRNNGADLRFLREPTVENPAPLAQMTLTGTGKLLLGTETAQSGLTFQVGDWFGVTYSGRVGFENNSPQAKIHFSNSSSTDCLRFPNGTVQNSAPFTDAGFNSGPGVVPGPTTQFLSVRKSIRITHSSQRLFVTVSQQFGGSRITDKALNIYVGYRQAGSTSVPTLVGAGLLDCQLMDQDCSGSAFCASGWRMPFALSAIIEGLQPGLYEVGMAGSSAFPGWDVGNGYVTAFVF